ncbi:MAG: helix-turn-helix transcriptional regulator, partial [Alphaproteobacteria bacterium]|nr:helix-turn-helix transcriptional regulator [Alphaproteobacteria bacterium]
MIDEKPVSLHVCNMQIREWRKAKSLTLADLATKVSLATSYLSQIETGARRPSPEAAKRIEVATNGEVTAAELLGIETPHHRPSLREDPATFDGAPVVSVA